MKKVDESKVLKDLGKRIAYLRHEKGYTQLSLSLEANVTKSYLSDLERGARNPSIKVLSRIAFALSVPLECLFQKED